MDFLLLEITLGKKKKKNMRRAAMSAAENNSPDLGTTVTFVPRLLEDAGGRTNHPLVSLPLLKDLMHQKMSQNQSLAPIYLRNLDLPTCDLKVELHQKNIVLPGVLLHLTSTQIPSNQEHLQIGGTPTSFKPPKFETSKLTVDLVPPTDLPFPQGQPSHTGLFRHRPFRYLRCWRLRPRVHRFWRQNRRRVHGFGLRRRSTWR